MTLERYEPNAPVTQDTDSWIQVVEAVGDLASKIAGTEFVPKGLRGSVPATAAAILYGREVGLPPMTALTQTHVIEGKPAVSAEAMRAMVLSQGHSIQIQESTSARCVMRGKRRGDDEWSAPVEWTIDQARQASLLGKTNWKSYPRQMLQARATAELCRLVFPDVIHGFRAVEELDAGEGVEGPAEGSGPSTTVQRKRRTAGTKGEATPVVVERPVSVGPPLPGEPGYTDPAGSAGGGEPPVDSAAPNVDGAPDVEGTLVELGDPSTPGEEAPDAPPPPDPQDEPAPVERPATKVDLRIYHASFKDVLSEIDNDDMKRSERMAITCAIVGRPLETSNELSQREARLVADTVSRHKSLNDLYALLDATVDKP